ncbi:hypothetical protein F383_03842 [Gossypium arboreum]|uniref:Uncharacterized protein n=1 Tax=Gossypium arboreum TaxID=29729 RepID=A0A0B0NCX0_GOSAR|nr:hypothetical protein F383_03842 [Gossypium arboreum]
MALQPVDCQHSQRHLQLPLSAQENLLVL